jgi:hypothetical protein
MANIMGVIVMYVATLPLSNAQWNIINFWGWEICRVQIYAI